jgi:hypothetical protein
MPVDEMTVDEMTWHFLLESSGKNDPQRSTSLGSFVFDMHCFEKRHHAKKLLAKKHFTDPHFADTMFDQSSYDSVLWPNVMKLFLPIIYGLS